MTKLAEQAATPSGKEDCLRIGLSDDASVVNAWYQEVGEWMAWHDQGGILPLAGGVDVRSALHAAVAGGWMDAEQCRDIAWVLQQTADVRRSVARPDLPRLAQRAAALNDLPQLRHALAEAIDSEGRLRESATPELRRLRREVDRLRASLVQRVEALLGEADYQPWLQESYVTQREERYVLPIKIEHRAKVSGIVHDVSSSGSTVFVEPQELVDANNDLKWAEVAVSQEIEQILRRLTEDIAAARPVIESNLKILTALDIIQAKGRLGRAYGGTVPRLSDGAIAWRGLRHPLLTLRDPQAIGNDVLVDPTVRALVISGPNTGGKTVFLKAIGLAACMTRAGLALACDAGSESPLLPSILMDIGDDQDLGRDLSTFAAHIRVVGAMLTYAPPRGLVLIDELATATDPDEGAALAQAVIEALMTRGVLTVVTTHYTALKAWAAAGAFPDRMSAGMGYDVSALAPTYRVTLGRPGLSLGLDVAGRLGLPPPVLERARTLINPQTAVLAGAIAELEREHHYAAALRARLATLETAARDAALRRDAAAADLERLRDEFSATRRARLSAEVDRAKGELDRLIESARREHDPRRLRVLRPALDRVGRLPSPPESVASPPRIERDAGVPVRVRSLGADGVLLEATQGRRRVRVQVGDREVSVDPAGLESAGTVSEAPSPAGQRSLEAPREAEETIKLIGLRVAEALDRLDRALDAASAAGISQVRLIHGQGTGRLKTAIRRHLTTSPYVSAQRAGDDAEGGDAVTIATMA